MPKKKRKPLTAAKLRAKCITLAKQIAKTRDGYQCQFCGRTKDRGWKIDGSHVIAVGRCGGKLACHPLNIKALCSDCHRAWAENPALMGPWYRLRFPLRWAYVDREYQVWTSSDKDTISILWWRERLEELKAELKELEG